MHYKKVPALKLYFMMNKASGTVCSSVSDSHLTVFESFEPQELVSPEGAKLHTVGRLDCDTEGLLLLTNDGKLSNYLTRPENRIPKKYYVELAKPVSKNDRKEYVQKASQGLVLPPEKKFGQQMCSGAKIEWIDEISCNITLTEGKFHEVKRIFLALGNCVARLVRKEFAGLVLDESIPKGQFRSLTQEEIQHLTQKMESSLIS